MGDLPIELAPQEHKRAELHERQGIDAFRHGLTGPLRRALLYPGARHERLMAMSRSASLMRERPVICRCSLKRLT